MRSIAVKAQTLCGRGRVGSSSYYSTHAQTHIFVDEPLHCRSSRTKKQVAAHTIALTSNMLPKLYELRFGNSSAENSGTSSTKLCSSGSSVSSLAPSGIVLRNSSSASRFTPCITKITLVLPPVSTAFGKYANTCSKRTKMITSFVR